MKQSSEMEQYGYKMVGVVVFVGCAFLSGCVGERFFGGGPHRVTDFDRKAREILKTTQKTTGGIPYIRGWKPIMDTSAQMQVVQLKSAKDVINAKNVNFIVSSGRAQGVQQWRLKMFDAHGNLIKCAHHDGGPRAGGGMLDQPIPCLGLPNNMQVQAQFQYTMLGWEKGTIGIDVVWFDVKY